MSDILAAHAHRLADVSLHQLFATESDRSHRLALEWGDWRIDFSKERLDGASLDALVAHAEAIGLPRWIEGLFSGERLNLSENRPALHTALRQQEARPVPVGGEDIMPAILATRRRMRDLAQRLREGAWRGATGAPIRRVVNLGIGGSDLGPRMVVAALGGSPGPVDVAFVANVDPEALSRILAASRPAETLFIVTSKTFTTQETLANAQAARQWLAHALGTEDLAAHFIGVSANVEAAGAFGIPPEQVLPMWDWVGGRYSLWSAVGLPIAVAHGPDAFEELLRGGDAMDRHVRSAPPASNAAVLLGALAWWNARWLGLPQRLVIPYSHALDLLPAFLQQLVLESNGKRVARDGGDVEGPTTVGLWGAAGTDAQHSFFQWLHQGTQRTWVEFILPVRAAHPLGDQQALLAANALAQAQALLVGRSAETIRTELAGAGLAGESLEAAIAARLCPGDRASTTVVLPTVDPWNLGALVALWEHRTFVEGVLGGINSFDQWGVELGKTLAKPIARALIDGASLPKGTDASTTALAAHVRRLAAQR